MSRPAKMLLLRDIAARITAHLQHFERDPKINKNKHYDQKQKAWVDDPRRRGVSDYYGAYAYARPRSVSVVYVSYQGSSQLKREQAEAYLAWLDAGNVGTHFKMERAE